MTEMTRRQDSSSAVNRETLPHDGAATEVAETRPFEGFFYLRKEWLDQEECIEKVTFNMTLGRQNLPADWNNTQSCVMMPEWGRHPFAEPG